jgi:uncharacterized membrane protein
MRISMLFAAVSIALCGTVHAEGTFIALQTPGTQVTMVSGNGAYAVGSVNAAAGYRWTASTGAEEVIPALDVALGVNNFGTIAGAVPVNGGAANGGTDLGAYAAPGADPVQLTDPLQQDSNGYGIADDGTVVGLSFDDNFVGPAIAFVWTATDGMVALPVNRPDTYSRANVISADASVIAGWNDQEDGFRSAVIWQDRVPFDVADADGNMVGEADGISSNGEFVVGSSYTDTQGDTGSWLWSATGGVQLIPSMGFAFGVSDDGKTVVGANGFFDNPPRAALIWQEGVGTMLLTDYLAAQDIAIPTGWDPGLAGGFGGISADGSLLAGWSSGPLGMQSYIIQIQAAANDTIFMDGFDGAAPRVP